MAVVKSDGYGLGAVDSARVFLENGAASLAIASFDEAVKLRSADIDAPILCLNAIPDALFQEALALRIEMSITSASTLEQILALEKQSHIPVKAHIKVDTGMSRGGVNFQDLQQQSAIRQLLSGSSVEQVGIYTDFAESDDATDFTFTDLQFERFIESIERIVPDGMPVVRHCANGAIGLRDQSKRMDMVRLGMILYGFVPPNARTHIDVHPVCRFESHVVELNRLDAGVAVGYGRKWKAESDTLVAQVPIGYYHGISSELNNNACVLIDGHPCSVVGCVSMNQLTVDVSGLSHIEVGDAVEISIGPTPTTEEFGIQPLIHFADICRIPAAVPRAYV